MFHNYFLFNQSLHEMDQPKMLINTLNAHSYNMACEDEEFRNALQSSDVLLPDGIGVVLATRVLTDLKLRKIAGEDLFYHEMNRLNGTGGKCFSLEAAKER
jgi:Teichoic acid biosynthesis proteins